MPELKLSWPADYDVAEHRLIWEVCRDEKLSQGLLLQVYHPK